jgi:hypothetical protein
MDPSREALTAGDLDLDLRLSLVFSDKRAFLKSPAFSLDVGDFPFKDSGKDNSLTSRDIKSL